MESFSEVLTNIDQCNLIHFKTINIRNYINDFEMVKVWLIGNDKETDKYFVLFKKTKENLTFLHI